MFSSKAVKVRLPRETNHKYSVMRFNPGFNANSNELKSCRLFRETEHKDIKTGNDLEFNEFGAGSVFGCKQREEIRRKRYQRKSTGGEQPWILETNGKTSTKYKGLQDSSDSGNGCYYAFFEAPDGAFEVFPIKDWYNFTPIQTFKALTAEQAEESFENRDKTLHHFSVLNRKDEEMAANNSELMAKVERKLKVSDMDDWNGMNSDNEKSDFEESSDENVKPKIKNKKKKVSSKKKKKGTDDDDNDSEPQEESDEGDFDYKEVDYMSDSSGSDESENEKIDKEIKSVVDEDAIKQLILSEDEDKDNDGDEQSENEGQQTQNGNKSQTEAHKKSVFKGKLKANLNSSSPSSDSDSDSDSLDIKKSAILAPIKQESDESSGYSSRSSTRISKVKTCPSGNVSSIVSEPLKRKVLSEDSSNMKKPKQSNDSSVGITEEDVRRCLTHRRMTCAEILMKFRKKVSNKEDLVNTIAVILKRLNPEKHTINNKTYLSL